MTSPLPAPLRQRVSLDDLRTWAELSGDTNRLHIDEEFAATTRYGRPIIHGHLTVTWLIQWATARWGIAFAHRGQLRDLRYRAPLRPDIDYRVVGYERVDGQIAVEIRSPDDTVAVEAVLSLRASTEEPA